MKRKENKAMRFASALLVLTLLAVSLTAGTFAKYATKDNGSATARVAKFGVDVAVNADGVFGANYDAQGEVTDTADGAIVSAKADAGKADNVVAPGTHGEMTFSIKGEPEVKVDLEIGFAAETLKEIMLKDNTTYKNHEDTVTLTENYYPVKWTLKKDSTPVADCTDVTLKEINTYFETLSKDYNVEEFKNVVGTYTLSWNWEFDDTGKGTNDVADTILGDLQANANDADIKKGTVDSQTETLAEGDYSLNEAFDLTISVTQVD